MNDKLKALAGNIRDRWQKWSKMQKGIFGGVLALAVVAVIVLSVVSTRSGATALFSAPITDTAAFDRIVVRLEK